MDIDTAAQTAWEHYVATQYLDRNSILHAHRAFIAGFKSALQQED